MFKSHFVKHLKTTLQTLWRDIQMAGTETPKGYLCKGYFTSFRDVFVF